jgi:hypothetical protein
MVADFERKLSAPTRRTSMPFDSERLHCFVDGLSHFVPERALEIVRLAARQQKPFAGALRQGSDDYFDVGIDDACEVFKRVGEVKGA